MKTGYAYHELNVGDVFISPSRTITESDVMLFAGLTGDLNELHTSKTFAEDTRFGKQIAHGMLTLAVANGLYFRIGLFQTSVFLGIESLRFAKPVFFGDTIQLELTIADKRLTKTKDRAVISMQYNVKNQDGDTVLEGLFNRMITVE